MDNVALIPARGGSKRIKKKNIKLFNGKPDVGRGNVGTWSGGGVR